MIKKYGDAQPINVVKDPDEIVRKNADDQRREILKFHDGNDKQKKQTRTET